MIVNVCIVTEYCILYSINRVLRFYYPLPLFLLVIRIVHLFAYAYGKRIDSLTNMCGTSNGCVRLIRGEAKCSSTRQEHHSLDCHWLTRGIELKMPRVATNTTIVKYYQLKMLTTFSLLNFKKWVWFTVKISQLEININNSLRI